MSASTISRTRSANFVLGDQFNCWRACAGLNWQDHVEIDPKFYRPAEVERLIGNPTKARQQLNWSPKTKFADLVRLMVEADIELLKKS